MIRPVRIVIVAFIVVVPVLAWAAGTVQRPDGRAAEQNDAEQNDAEQIDKASCPSSPAVSLSIDVPGALRDFNDDEFQRLVDLTGPTRIVAGPKTPILGNLIADARIRSMAEARGYRPRRDYGAADLVSVDGGRLLKQSAADAWGSMQAAARSDGVSLTLWSAYRSTADQRQIFVDKLSERGHDAASVSAGRADAAIDDILRFTSIPGYSRHHTGHTIDILSPNFGSSTFHRSEAYEWLSRDNYANAKDHGFVPSYPPKAGQQGPDPESWEFVYAGRTAVTASDRLAPLQRFDLLDGPTALATGTSLHPADEFVLYADGEALATAIGRCNTAKSLNVFELEAPYEIGADLCVVQRWAAGERLLACRS